MLVRWKRHQERTFPVTDDTPILTVFRTTSGQRQVITPIPMSKDTITRIVYERSALVPEVGHLAPHDLRRTLARIMHEQRTPDGARRHDLSDIQAALGHSITSGAVTQACYIGPLDDGARKEAGQLIDEL